MQPPTKDQTDIGVDNPKIDASDGADLETEHNITENKDMARQEFAKEADINYMLSRFGVVPARGAPTYGEWDDSVNLQSALDSTREAREAYKRVPEEIRKRFTSMEQLLSAVENGSLVIKDEQAPTATTETPGAPQP